MKITNIWLKGSWKEVLNDCRFTVSKPPLDKEPSERFKKHILIAEHSPIRDIHIKFDIIDLGTCFITHLVRHMWEPFVRSQRTDKTGVDRHSLPQDSPNDMRGDMNIQNAIDTSRKRLCFKSSTETREAWELFKYELHKVDPYISDVLVPNCVYRCGCPEEDPDADNDKCCNMCWTWLPLSYDGLVDIRERYAPYNEWLYAKWKKKKGE